MKKLERLISASRIVLVLAISTAISAACGAPQLPAPTREPTALPVETQQFPTVTIAPTTTPTREATALPTALPEHPTRTAPIGDGGMNFDFPQLIFPTANGLMAVAADGTQPRLLSEAQPVIIHNLKDGIAPFSGWLAFIKW